LLDMEYYIIALAAIIAAVYIIKKVASCMIRTVVFIVMLAILAIAYYYLQL